MTASHVTTPSTAERIRPWVVLIALPVTLAAAALGSGALGGQEVQASSSGALSADATPLAPASTAFSIWSVIYLGLAAYAIWQVLPKQRRDPRQRSISWLATASLVLNATWILCAQAGLLPLTVVVIVLLLGVLAAIFALLRRIEPRSTLEALLVDGTFGLYLGWVSVATVANIAAALAAAGWRPDPFEPLAIVVLAAVAVVGVADDRWGEVGVAWVVVRRGATTDIEDLREHAGRNLARYKVPREIHFVDAIPRSASSKVLRRHLLAAWTLDPSCVGDAS